MSSAKNLCQHAGAATQFTIQKSQIGRFPEVMWIRVGYPCEKLQTRDAWGNMLIPYRLVWDGITYEFLGIIVADSSMGAGHFGSVIKIGGELYKQGEHETRSAGLMRSIAAAGKDVAISSLLSAKANEYPVGFYYVKKGETDGSGNWTDVRVRLQRPGHSTSNDPVANWAETVDNVIGDGKLMIVLANVPLEDCAGDCAGASVSYGGNMEIDHGEDGKPMITN